MKCLAPFLCLFCLSLSLGHAQQKEIRKADRKFDKMEYAYAAYIYEKVVEAGYGSEEIYKKLGDAFYFQSQPDRAAPYYAGFLETQLHPDPEYYFRYAISLRAKGEYAEADVQMEKFMADAYEDLRSRKFRKHRNYLEEIALQTGRYDLDTLGFNSAFADFAPSALGDKLIFASARGRGLPNAPVDRWSAQPFLDLYAVDTAVIAAGEETGFKVRGLVNTILHESTTSFNAEGDVMYFTTNHTVLNDPNPDSTGVTRLRIMRAYKDDKGRWGDVEDLPINSKHYSTAHPALTPDGKMLFFVSDRPGGFGASDLWRVAVDSDGNLGGPVNLGSLINTPGRETFPFVNTNSELFFAADGHPGLGALDVFVSRLDENFEVLDIYNLGAPVNSPADDFGYMETRANKLGYFASNRPGGKGNDDIFGFTQTKPIIRKCVAAFDALVTSGNGVPLEGAAWHLIDDKGERLLTGNAPDDGRFALEYDCDLVNFVRVEKEGYETLEVYINDKEHYTFLMEENRVRLTPGVDLSEVLHVRPVYFEFDSYRISGTAEADLQKIVQVMEEYPELRIEIRAFTDSRGPAAYNQKLSERRAEATAAYLVKAGIDASRLQATGFGESQPIADCGEERPCTREEHAKNRRSAFVIIE